MAKVTFPGYLPSYEFLSEQYLGDLGVTSSTAKKMVITDEETGNRVILTGTGLDDETGEASDLVGVTFEHSTGKDFIVVKDGQFDFLAFYNALMGEGVDEAFLHLVEGKDTITGSKASEWIHGGAGKDVIDGKAGTDHILGEAGNDILTGGKDDDFFHFDVTSGHDKIKDFYVYNDSASHDVIYVLDEIPDYVVTKIDGGIKVEIEDGAASLTLLGVKARYFDDADFQIYHDF